MISEKMSGLLRNKGRIILQRLDPKIKYISTISDKTNLHHLNRNSFLNTLHSERLLFKNYSFKQLHRDITVHNSYFVFETKYAHSVLENSQVYSNCLAPPPTTSKDLQIDEVDDLLKKQWISMSNTEILNNFELLSYYVFKNQETLNDSKYQGILEILASRSAEFSDKELHQLLNNLQLWIFKKDEQILNNFWKVLDDECMKRLPNWTVDEILFTNDQFYKLRVTRYLNFPWHSLRKLGRKPKKLSAANLVHFTFLLKVNRKIKINLYNVEYFFEKYADELTIDELAIAAMTFFKYETSIKSKDFLIKIMQKLQDNIDTVNDVTLTAIFKSLRYIHNPEITKLFNNLFTSLESQISSRSLATVAQIVDLKRKVVIHNETLMLNALERFEKEIKVANVKDIEKILFALCIFNYNPETTNFYSVAFNELLQPDKAEDIQWFSRSLTNCVTYALKVGFYSEKALKQIMEPEYIGISSKSGWYKINSEYLFLDYCIELEHSQYNGPRLDKKILNYLLKKFGPLEQHVINRGDRITYAQNMITDVVDTCKQALGSESAIHVDSLLPCYAVSEFVVCYDQKTNKFVPPGEKLSQIPAGTIKYAPEDGNKWYVLVLGTKFYLTKNTCEPTGYIEARLRLLKRIGYTPIMIPFNEWDCLNSESEKQEYITNILPR